MDKCQPIRLGQLFATKQDYFHFLLMMQRTMAKTTKKTILGFLDYHIPVLKVQQIELLKFWKLRQQHFLSHEAEDRISFLRESQTTGSCINMQSTRKTKRTLLTQTQSLSTTYCSCTILLKIRGLQVMEGLILYYYPSSSKSPVQSIS